MASDSPNPSGGRQTAIWPWLLLPLVTLAMFFALRSLRDAAEARPVPAATEPGVEIPVSPLP
nr:MAG: hypothetical protein DIU56_16330 [Pseudomonadota bacterium]